MEWNESREAVISQGEAMCDQRTHGLYKNLILRQYFLEELKVNNTNSQRKKQKSKRTKIRKNR